MLSHATADAVRVIRESLPGSRALERFVTEAAASARSRREIPQPEKPAKMPDPQA